MIWGNSETFWIIFWLLSPILWPSHAKSWLIGKDPDAGRDWGQEEKGTTEDEMVGWHHRLDAHEFGWTPGVGDGQGGLACCDSWSCKESDTTEWLNWTDCLLNNHAFVLSCSVMSNSLWPRRLPGSSVLGDSPGKNTDCHALLQRISPTQRSNPGLLHDRQILYQLSHQGSPTMLLFLASVETKLACYCSLIYYFNNFEFASKKF